MGHRRWAARAPRRLTLAPRDVRLGPMERPERHLDVDEGVRRQHELDLRTPSQQLGADDAALSLTPSLAMSPRMTPSLRAEGLRFLIRTFAGSVYPPKDGSGRVTELGRERGEAL